MNIGQFFLLQMVIFRQQTTLFDRFRDSFLFQFVHFIQFFETNVIHLASFIQFFIIRLW